MRINSINTRYNFGAKPLYSIILKDKNGEDVKANFSELDIFDPIDAKRVSKIGELWLPKDPYYNFSSIMAHSFLYPNSIIENQRRFYVTELDNPLLNDYDKTVAFLETSNPFDKKNDFLELYYIQSATAIKPEYVKTQVKGAGEQALYGLARIAKKNNIPRVRVFSTNDDFYKKMGLIPKKPLGQDGRYFVLPKNSYDKFLDKIESKYQQGVICR